MSVRAAGELFVAQGYTKASLAAVAMAAGVARPTVTASFGSKAALLKQVIDDSTRLSPVTTNPCRWPSGPGSGRSWRRRARERCWTRTPKSVS
ncbi:TetR family transcriptional regulator [Actinoplanes aureus]|uniref:TetR family transcriptional regulator n=1 Tax=Actinoplanes aureus TaxID=2792083 RepID=UPI0028158659|nr:TetR family transcriptional regulator [Actinoplanes aureus]